MHYGDIYLYAFLQDMPETSEPSHSDSVPTTSSESVLSSKEALKEKQNLPSPLGDTATSNEPQRKKKKDQECISDTSTDKDQVQEDLQLSQHETATNKEVCERELGRWGEV